MQINGSLINTYFVCKRKAWLFHNKIGMEHNSENVFIGKIYHEQSNKEITIDNIKIDEIDGEYIVEKKKSRSNLEAAILQLKYYLYVLNNKGIKKKGKIYIFETNEEIIVDYLQDFDIVEICEAVEKIEHTINKEIPPIINSTNCKKCAYYEYCYC